jgi:hypothetical protein
VGDADWAGRGGFFGKEDVVCRSINVGEEDDQERCCVLSLLCAPCGVNTVKQGEGLHSNAKKKNLCKVRIHRKHKNKKNTTQQQKAPNRVHIHHQPTRNQKPRKEKTQKKKHPKKRK